MSSIKKALLGLVGLTAILVSVSSSRPSDEQVSYSGFVVYRTVPKTEEQLQGLRSIMLNRDDEGIQFWTQPGHVNQTVDIMASPSELDDLQVQLQDLKIHSRRIMHDVGKVIARTSVASLPPMSHRSSAGLEGNASDLLLDRQILESVNFYTKFQPYRTLEFKLNELNQNPAVKVETAGKSFEGRNIYLVKVSSDHEAKRPVIFIDAGHHAREWISHATGMYILESLVNEAMPFVVDRQTGVDNKQRRDLKSLLANYDFWFVPVVNPDGYEYTHSTDRLWRRTRSRNGCQGVDPNRNYDFHWSRSYVCGQTYSGPYPLSEPETQAVANALDTNKDRISMYISLHSYSQVILTPYGYTRARPDNFQELMRVCQAGSDAINSLRQTEFKCGQASVMLYLAPGGSDDYAYGHSNIPLAYTIELPDKGEYGFIAPAREIVPIGQETVIGLKAMVEAISESKKKVG